MRLLIGIGENNLLVPRSDIVSFLLYDHRRFPSVLGIEYPVEEGIVRTFSDHTSSDFASVLQRSGLGQTDTAGITYGTANIMVNPYLGKGIPEWFSDIARLLVINDYGKHLFAAVKENTDGGFRTAAYGAANFEQFVQSVF